MGVMRPRREVNPELVEEWDRLRTTAAAALAELVTKGPNPEDDLLQALAWRSGFPEPEPWDPERVELVARAIDERYTWREIALALGFGEAGIDRCQAKYHYRTQSRPG